MPRISCIRRSTARRKVIGGLTGDQRFFLAYAQAWQAKVREGAARQLLLTDPHSPAKYRVNGIVRNVDAWYKAFNIQAGRRAVSAAREARAYLVRRGSKSPGFGASANNRGHPVGGPDRNRLV